MITTSDYPLESTTSHCYFDILRKSLVTNINKQHNSLPTVNEKHFKKLNYNSKDMENNILKIELYVTFIRRLGYT